MHYFIILAYLVNHIRSNNDVPICNKDWEDADNVGLGYLWIEKSQKMNYADAKIFCESKNANLIEIESQDQMNFIKEKLKSVGESMDPDQRDDIYWWGGATDEDKEGTWKWTQSGKTFDTTSFVWAEGQPNNAGGNGEDYFCFWNKRGYLGNDCGGSLKTFPLRQRKM